MKCCFRKGSVFQTSFPLNNGIHGIFICWKTTVNEYWPLSPLRFSRKKQNKRSDCDVSGATCSLHPCCQNGLKLEFLVLELVVSIAKHCLQSGAVRFTEWHNTRQVSRHYNGNNKYTDWSRPGGFCLLIHHCVEHEGNAIDWIDPQDLSKECKKPRAKSHRSS